MTVPYPVTAYPNATPVRDIVIEKGVVANFAFYAGDPDGDDVGVSGIINVVALVADPVEIALDGVPGEVRDREFLEWVAAQPKGRLFRFDVQVSTEDIETGTHKIGFEIQDTQGSQNTVTFNLVVEGPNEPPFATG